MNTHPIKLKEAVETFASCKASLDFFEKIKPVTVVIFFFSSSVVSSRSSSSSFFFFFSFFFPSSSVCVFCCCCAVRAENFSFEEEEFCQNFKNFRLEKKKKRVKMCCVVWSKVSFLSTLPVDKIRLREEDE